MIAVAPSLVRTLDPDDLDRVLIHEWAHVQRRDDVVNILQVAVRIVAGWHPALWWIDRRLHLEREIACDEVAVAITGSPKSYAECLLKLSTLRGTPRPMQTAPAVFTRVRSARTCRQNRDAAPVYRAAVVSHTGRSDGCDAVPGIGCGGGPDACRGSSIGTAAGVGSHAHAEPLIQRAGSCCASCRVGHEDGTSTSSSPCAIVIASESRRRNSLHLSPSAHPNRSRLQSPTSRQLWVRPARQQPIPSPRRLSRPSCRVCRTRTRRLR